MRKVIKEYILKEKYKILSLVIVQLLIVVANIIVPYVLGKFIDNLINYKTSNFIIKFAISFIIIYILTSLLTYINAILLTNQKNILFYDISNYILRYVRECKYSEIRNMDVNYTTEQISSDTNIIVEFIFNIIINFINNLVQILIISIVVSKINIIVSIIFLVTIPCYVMIYYIYKQKLYFKSHDFRVHSSKLYSITNELISNIWFFKINGLYVEMNERYKDFYNSYLKSAINYAKCNSLFNSIQSSISNLSQLIIFIYCGVSILNGSLTIGSFTILNNYYNMIVNKIGFFLSLSSSYQQFRVAKGRINLLLNKAKEKNGTQLIETINSIEIKNLSFYYGEKLLFNKFSYKFKKGKIYGIVGKNGTGKSTLINILLFIEQSYSGDILYNGIDVVNLNMIDLRKNKISVIEQFPVLLNESIDYNINLINTDKITLDVFSNVDFLHSIVNSENLSGGESKKLSIIRGLSKISDVVILDEPDAALDNFSIKEITHKIEELSKDKIVIIITHSNNFDGIINEKISI